MKDTDKYEDIINLPHYQSKNRSHMTVFERAAQFSPFAALKGYDDEIEEAARLTGERMGMDDVSVSELNEMLTLLKDKAKERPAVRITFFRTDPKKPGGKYVTVDARLKSVDEYQRKLILADETSILFDDLLCIELTE